MKWNFNTSWKALTATLEKLIECFMLARKDLQRRSHSEGNNIDEKKKDVGNKGNNQKNDYSNLKIFIAQYHSSIKECRRDACYR